MIVAIFVVLQPALLITSGYILDSVCKDDVITCACGRSGEQTKIRIKRCLERRQTCQPCDGEPYTRESLCRQFKYCKTCSTERYGGCMTCPDGLFGKTCSFEQTCGKPPGLANGFVEGADWAEQSRVKYFCDQSYVLTGDHELICVEDQWTGVKPKCSKSCGPPPDLQGGGYEGSFWGEGGRVGYYCTTETLLGDDISTCRNGKWTGAAPSCGRLCGPPPDIQDGGYEGSYQGEGGKVVYFCTTGTLLGDDKLICRNGKWTGTTPSCVQSCGQPPDLQQGGYESSFWGEGGRVAYFCTTGTLLGDDTLTCRKGKWTGAAPSCGHLCGPPPDIQDGGYEGSFRGEGGIVAYFCTTGTLLGDDRLICRNGEWTGTAPSCVQSCGPPPNLHRGGYEASFWGEGGRAAYFCTTGTLLGDDTLTCRKGKWTGTAPSCGQKQQTCGQPPNLYNGRYESTDWTEGSIVDYFCNSRWDLSGDSQLTCRNGWWTGTRPVCGIACQLPVVSNGLIDPVQNLYTVNSRITLTCSSGYRSDPVTPVWLTCLNNGSWSSTVPRCTKTASPTAVVKCSVPPHPNNGRVSLAHGKTVVHPGERLTLVCNQGYSLSFPNTAVCLTSGTWSAKFPTCFKRHRCEQPPHVRNGWYEGPDRSEGAVVHYFCNKRWHLSGDPKLICKNRRWTGVVPYCQVTCLLPIISNGIIDPVQRIYIVNSRVSVTCSTGYRREPSTPVTHACLKRGTWSATLPRCMKIAMPSPSSTCPTPPSPVNGRLETTAGQSGFQAGLNVTFSCNKGYVISGPTSSTCRTDGTWSDKSPRCLKLVTCADPGVPSNSVVTTTRPSAVAGRKSNFGRALLAGFNRRGRLRIAGRPTPLRTIQQLKVPRGQYQVFSTLKFSCKSDAYMLVGSTQRICQSSGSWSGQQPSCTPVCGKSKSLKSPTIINGDASRLGDWPWQAFIAFRQPDGTYFGACGGSLISDEWVITAGHCMANQSIQDLRVYLGKYYRDYTRDDTFVKQFDVREIRIHPLYNPAVLDADVALIRLSRKVTFNSRISPICLTSLDAAGERLTDTLVNSGSVLTILGWGQTEKSNKATLLKVAQIRTISNSACEQKYAQRGMSIMVTRHMFCAGQNNGQTDACYGDSGGPAMVISGSGSVRKWHLVGVISWGSPVDCGLPGQYGGYTRLSRFLKFIKNVTGL